MHSSRMRTARSLIVSPYLVVSHAHPPRSNHARQPGATMHAPPGATMHAPKQPCMPPRSNHTCPLGSNHACPLLGATTHAPPEQPRMPIPQEQPCTSPQEQPRTPPGATMHAPQEQPHMPPPVNRMTNRCKNITLPQTSFAGGKNNQGGHIPTETKFYVLSLSFPCVTNFFPCCYMKTNGLFH